MGKIFITGASGFIGTNLINHLYKQGHKLVNYDIAKPRNPAQTSLWQPGDVRDLTGLKTAIEKFSPDYLIHLAARTDLDGKNIDEYDSNTIGTLNIVEAIANSKTIKKVLFTSSRLVCKIGYTPSSDDDYCPTTFYGESKVIGERIVKEKAYKINPSWMILRPTSIWGPWFGTPYKEFFMSVLRSRYFHPKGLRITKSFGFVGNSVYQIEKLLDAPNTLTHSKTFYLTDYPPIEVNHWANLIAQKNGKQKVREAPIWFLATLAFAGNLLKKMGMKKPPLTTFRLNNIITNMVYNTQNLENICGKLPDSTETGIEKTLEWLKTQQRYR
jgi:GlcNAc-P-P-Und epimerase